MKWEWNLLNGSPNTVSYYPPVYSYYTDSGVDPYSYFHNFFEKYYFYNTIIYRERNKR